MTREQITNDFIAQIEAGNVTPDLMASVIYAMHNTLMDRFESVAMWIDRDLEQVADSVVKAIQCDENQPELEAFQLYRLSDEDSARLRYQERKAA
jgi:Mg2+ and Co2+ transporter CorA